MKKIIIKLSDMSKALRKKADSVFELFKVKKNDIVNIFMKGGPARNRMLVLFFAGLFLFDYALYCFHVEKNPFDIFPSLPVLERKADISVYLPSPDGETHFEEIRSVPADLSEKGYVSYLFDVVAGGSIYRNTSTAVPAELLVKDIFIYEESGSGERLCIINIDPVLIDPGAKVIEGSEQLFKAMVEKTITANLPEIKRVYILERGIAGKKLWEL